MDGKYNRLSCTYSQPERGFGLRAQQRFRLMHSQGLFRSGSLYSLLLGPRRSLGTAAHVTVVPHPHRSRQGRHVDRRQIR